MQAAWSSTSWWPLTTPPPTATRGTPVPCTTSASAPRCTRVRLFWPPRGLPPTGLPPAGLLACCAVAADPLRPLPSCAVPRRRDSGGGRRAAVLRLRQILPRLGLWRGAAARGRRQPLLRAQRQPGAARGGGRGRHPAGLQVGRAAGLHAWAGSRFAGRRAGLAESASCSDAALLRLPAAAGTRWPMCGCRGPRCLPPSSTPRPRCVLLAEACWHALPRNTCAPLKSACLPRPARRSPPSPLPPPSILC